MTWIFKEKEMASKLEAAQTLVDSNIYVFNVNEVGDIQIYETYRKIPEMPLLHKPYGLMTDNFSFFNEANKWVRRKDLTGVNIRATYLDVSAHSTSHFIFYLTQRAKKYKSVRCIHVHIYNQENRPKEASKAI